MSDLIEKMAIIQKVVDEQADDPAIWGFAKHITEALLQQELRRLHHVIETGQYMAPTHWEK